VDVHDVVVVTRVGRGKHLARRFGPFKWYRKLITRRTVLVLGAGASHHLLFPLGRGLRQLIVDNLKTPTSPMFSVLVELSYGEHAILEFMKTLERSFSPSVDVFLEKQPEASGNRQACHVGRIDSV
jgi:hypothetical protein